MTQLEIVPLRPQDVEEAMALLVTAFEQEGITKEVFDVRKASVRDRYTLLSILKTRVYLEAGQPVYIARLNQAIVGILIMKGKTKLPLTRLLRIILPQAFRALPLLLKINWSKAFKVGRMISSSKAVPEEAILLEAIAVRSDHRGMGMASKLMKQAETVAKDKVASGIYLYTADEPNKEIYEHLGYKVMEKRQTDGLTVYHMYRFAEEIA